MPSVQRDDRQSSRLARLAGADGGVDRSPAARSPTTFGDAGFTDVVLLGMGGSSLAPEVLRAVIGVAARLAAVAHARLDRSGRGSSGSHRRRRTTLYLLASKSGTTIEPNSLAAHFQRVLAGQPASTAGPTTSSRSPTTGTALATPRAD